MGELMDRGANTVRGGIGGALKGALIGVGIGLLLGLGFGLLMGFAILPALGVAAAAAAKWGVIAGILGGAASAVAAAPLAAKIGGGVGAVVGGLRNPIQSQTMGVVPQQGQGMVAPQPQPGQYMGVATTDEINAGYQQGPNGPAGYAQGRSQPAQGQGYAPQPYVAPEQQTYYPPQGGYGPQGVPPQQAGATDWEGRTSRSAPVPAGAGGRTH